MSALMRREPQGALEINQLHNNRKGAEMEEKRLLQQMRNFTR